MNKKYICNEIIKVANELDKSGDFELANELTKTAKHIANIKKAQVAAVTTQPVQPAQATTTQVNPQQQQILDPSQRARLLAQALQSRNVDEVIKYVQNGFAKREYQRIQNEKRNEQQRINNIFQLAVREYYALAPQAYGSAIPVQQTTAQPTQASPTQVAPTQTAPVQR